MSWTDACSSVSDIFPGKLKTYSYSCSCLLPPAQDNSVGYLTPWCLDFQDGFFSGMVLLPITSKSCSLSPVVLSPRLTSILLCKAPSNNPERGGWNELLIKKGQADGSDRACQEQRERGESLVAKHSEKVDTRFSMTCVPGDVNKSGIRKFCGQIS